MARDTEQWTIEDLVDFEQAAASLSVPSEHTRADIAAAVRKLDGAEARRAGLRMWLEETDRKSGGGRKFSSALSLTGVLLSLLLFLSGISATLGLLDRTRGGMNVTLFLTILIGGQWLALLLAASAWLSWRSAAEGFSPVQIIAGKLARKLSGIQDDTWWRRLMDGGGVPRAAVLWRVARLAQAAGIFFNAGILVALAALVLVRHIGFYWETSTEFAMRHLLEDTTRFLSAPWSAFFPTAVPDAAVIDASRWQPGKTGGLPPGPAAWWKFLLMTTFVWGLLPRAVLWFIAWQAGRQALASLDFQGRHHRALWRDITGNDRAETAEKPLDGVLVLDVGGSGLTENLMRPFLLRRLRVHPAVWQPVAVLEDGAESDAAAALAKAPAGVVLLAEGWALSPARMRDLHARVRAATTAGTPVKFLVANVSTDGSPLPVTEEEQPEWIHFVDSLRDPEAEVFFFEVPQEGL